MVGLADGGRVTSSVSGTGVGGSVVVGVVTTGVALSAGNRGGRLAFTVAEGGRDGVFVGAGGCMAKEGVQLPPLMSKNSVATRIIAKPALITKPRKLPGRKRIAIKVSKPNIPAHAK